MPAFLFHQQPLTNRRRAITTAVCLLAATALSAPVVAQTDDSGDGATPTTSTTAPAPTTTAPPATTTAPTTTVPETTTTTTTSTTTTTTPTTTSTTAPGTGDEVPTTENPVETTTPVPVTETTIIAPPPSESTPSTSVPETTIAPGTTLPTARNVQVFPEQIEHILATIRYLESRGIYTLPPNKGDASGAYQFIGSTWNNYGGYSDAYLAPPAIQDERAAKDVQAFLDRFNNDVSMVPVMWYLPAAANNPALMDIVPKPQHGNVLTIREYQTRWLGVFSFISGQPVAPRVGPADLSTIAGLAPELPEPHDGVPTMSFPVLGPSRVAIPDCDDATAVAEVADADGTVTGPSRDDIEAAGLCTEQAPGIVFGVKLQPVLAVADGVVTDVTDEPGSGQPITVTITDADGTSIVYAGFNDDTQGTDDGAAPDHLRLTSLATVGRVVRAGQVIGFMGDTDPLPIGVRADVPTDATVQIDPDAVAPHIRITMIDIDGQPIDAFGPMVDALFRQSCSVMLGAWSTEANGSGHEPVTIETTDNDDSIDSQWVIDSNGRVSAAGWATIVNPSEGCGYAPAETFGPGQRGGVTGALRWVNPIELPTDVWVALSTRGDNAAAGFLRR